MSKVMVVPCSGIGKVFGLMAREVALEAGKEENAQNICLAHIVTGDDEAVKRIKDQPCIAIDGCAKKCAAKAMKQAGGKIEMSYLTMSAMKKHRGTIPGSGTTLSDEGWEMVDELTEEVKAKITEIS